MEQETADSNSDAHRPGTEDEFASVQAEDELPETSVPVAYQYDASRIDDLARMLDRVVSEHEKLEMFEPVLAAEAAASGFASEEPLIAELRCAFRYRIKVDRTGDNPGAFSLHREGLLGMPKPFVSAWGDQRLQRAERHRSAGDSARSSSDALYACRFE